MKSRATMTAPLKRAAGRAAFTLVAAAMVCCLLSTRPAKAQAIGSAASASLPKVHYFQDANQAPGAVAAAQVLRQVPGAGTFQAVSVSGPENLKIGLARDGYFLDPIEAPVITGMLVGSVYRFRVTNIPLRPGEELYPSVEIISRVFAPAGKEHRFPIPVVLTREDLYLALDGALVTRVIYLEDSEIAEPVAAVPGTQRTLDVDAADNALQTADQLGRPMAILRIGSRVPADLTGDLSHFMYGCPPWIPLPPVPNREQMIADGLWPEVEAQPATEELRSEKPASDYPRVPMGY
jgi:hypothetical protein